APAPLLRDIGRRSRAASRVHHEVAGVRRHQQAALNCGCTRLNDVNLRIGSALNPADVRPGIRQCEGGEVVEEANIAQRVARLLNASRSDEASNTLLVRLPLSLLREVASTIQRDGEVPGTSLPDSGRGEIVETKWPR